ncbi:MAG: hypothetical protein EZS28_011801 [Streblomastix strix]|uniref:Uncharacterized protein n=1 Tax=Streblomastix strix TaxID=222440 RepID=A0A5J4WCK7_9EUKA|nr:MAG: hypothetical protein EZS28_011801 [Streblomastix strix]
MDEIISKMKKRLDEPNDDDSFFTAIRNIFRYVLIFSEKVGNSEQNPVKEQFETDGTIDKLVQIFEFDKLKNKKVYQLIAASLAGIYKASQLPSKFGQQITTFLKLQSNPDIEQIFIHSILAISWLAECQGI